MKKKTLADYEKARQKANERQRQYRHENPELYEVWKQRSYANYLRRKGWKVVEPPNFPTPAQVREKRDILALLDEPIFDPDELNINPEDLPFE